MLASLAGRLHRLKTSNQCLQDTVSFINKVSRDGIGWKHRQINGETELRSQFEERASRDATKPEQLGRRFTAKSLGDVRGHGHGGTSNLRLQAEPL